MEGSVSGDAQATANELADSATSLAAGLTDAAQSLANQVVDLGEEGARTVIGAVIAANSAVGAASAEINRVLESVSAKLVG